ncbi:DUF5957 family protein [Nocardiopsis kunsanensis]|uniref:DUF5957 family protein n=1 Tax=Nocardiopsis kunsanensis TaxID=141693 RepID=UPI000344FE08|nr:DUF5957 family protein [Nocardiopsis kunsanensis]
MRALKAIGAAALGLIAGGAVGFALSEVLAVLLFVLGGGELPEWAPALRYFLPLFAAFGLICAPVLVSRERK